MTNLGFLIDEHIPHSLIRAVRQLEPSIQVYKIGQPDSPRLRAPDPDLLIWIEEHNCYLVTNNRRTMPKHLTDHLLIGRHIPGIIVIPQKFVLRSLAVQLHLIWGASLADEYKDRIVYLPSDF